MSEDDRQRQMDFLLEQQAVFHSEIIELKDRVDKTSENVDRLAAKVDRLADVVLQQAEAAEVDRQDLRRAIDNLIIANEVTRDLANKAAQLAVNRG